MKIAKLHRKPVSMFVAIAFTVMLCYWANQTPAAPAVPAPEKSSAMSPGSDESESPGFIEQEEPAHAYKKGKKFPWLIVALVVIAGGAAVYFLVVKKKNYTLTVVVGEGVTGTPSSGSSSNKKGTVVNYNYALESGYSDLSVTLDGAPIAASGSVTMNGNHTLEAKANKTFVLTVSRGEHVSGTPNSGSYTYSRGSNVAYSYAPASGYSNLEVKLDNVMVADSGTINMDNNHTLTATLYGANLQVNSTPAGAKIYLDNVDSGQVTPYTFTFPTAVTKAVHLRYSCGFKEYATTVSVALGQTKTVNNTATPGISETFKIPASPCWHPYVPSRWTSVYELYKYSGTASQWDANVYYYSFVGDYSVSVHMNRQSGKNTGANDIFLGTGTSMTNASGYAIQYSCDGRYSVYRNANYNFITGSGGSTALRSWTSTPTIVQGLNKFNTIKIVKSGSNYSYYINGTLVTTFSDATYNPTYVALLFYDGGTLTKMQYNNVILTMGGTSPAPTLRPPENVSPETGDKRDQSGSLIQR
jgi:hypothetical protein